MSSMRNILLLLLVSLPISCQNVRTGEETTVASYRPLPTLREQAVEQQEWLQIRLDRVLPKLMQEYNTDMWILSMREYAEDPVFWSITAPTTFAARRRSIYVFTKRDDGTVEKLALGGTSQGGVFQAFRSSRPAPTQPTAELVGDEQWNLLRELLEDRDPNTIVLNIDPVWAFSDGLHSGESEVLMAAIGEKYRGRVKREPRLAMNYISLRIPEMLPRYRKMQETVHAIISEAFSNTVITPGTTTTDDVRWWMRQKLQELGYTTWFQTNVDVQRRGGLDDTGESVIIQFGDLLWTDFGVVAMNLHTDTQHLGYVMPRGEAEVPMGLKQCLSNSNRLQDILLGHMEPGLTGNQVLRATLEQMHSEDINGTVYTHPIGDHGHGAGPLIGRWDAQEGVPIRGEATMLPNVWHSIELQATTEVPEWGGQEVSCRQEEEAYLDENGDRQWIYERQNTFHVVW